MNNNEAVEFTITPPCCQQSEYPHTVRVNKPKKGPMRIVSFCFACGSWVEFNLRVEDHGTVSVESMTALR